MPAETRKLRVNILFISGQPTDKHEIKEHLWKSETVSYHVEHRPDFFGSIGLLQQDENSIDVILLDIGMFGSPHSREVFRRMVELAHGIPIIVFTDRDNHDMAMLAIEDGAAGNITRGGEGTDVFKFRDAIEFALVRAESARELDARNTNDLDALSSASKAKIGKLEEDRDVDIIRRNDQYAAMVKVLTERGDDDIVLAVREISDTLRKNQLETTILLAEARGNETTGQSSEPEKDLMS